MEESIKLIQRKSLITLGEQMSYLTSTRQNFDRLLPGYGQLTRAEKTRISEFSLVWQLFESQLFANNATAPKMRNDAWFGQGHVAILESANSALVHFRHRYVEAGDSEQRLRQLLGDRPESLRNCIVEGLTGDVNPTTATRACGAVCMRLRNNLFHGVKGNYGYRNQRENFKQGIIFMNSCIALRR